MMEKSFNCCVLDASNITSFPFPILSDNDGKFVNINNKRIALDNLTVGYLREFMCPNVDVSIMRELKLWKVNVKKQEIKDKNISTKEDIEQKLHGEEMEPEESFERYFRNELDNKKFARFNIHIIVQMPPPPPATTGKCLPMVYLSNKKFADLLLISLFLSFHFPPILPQRTTKEKKAPLV
jgi:hypothetical protein